MFLPFWSFWSWSLNRGVLSDAFSPLENILQNLLQHDSPVEIISQTYAWAISTCWNYFTNICMGHIHLLKLYFTNIFHKHMHGPYRPIKIISQTYAWAISTCWNYFTNICMGHIHLLKSTIFCITCHNFVGAALQSIEFITTFCHG